MRVYASTTTRETSKRKDAQGLKEEARVKKLLEHDKLEKIKYASPQTMAMQRRLLALEGDAQAAQGGAQRLKDLTGGAVGGRGVKDLQRGSAPGEQAGVEGAGLVSWGWGGVGTGGYWNLLKHNDGLL